MNRETNFSLQMNKLHTIYILMDRSTNENFMVDDPKCRKPEKAPSHKKKEWKQRSRGFIHGKIKGNQCY